MTFQLIRKGLAAAALVALASGPALAQGKVLRADTQGAGSTPAVLMVALAELVQKHTDMRLQVSTGKPATRSAVDAARGDVQIFAGAAPVSHYMLTQTQMYAEMADAKELASRIRSIVNFPSGAYHIVVWEKSGIRTMEDLKGKKLFIGPPGSSAVRSCTAMLQAVGGFEPNKDYTTANLDWTGGFQAFQDGEVDAYFSPSAMPAAQFQQLASTGKIRFLTLSEDAINSPQIQDVLSVPGRTVETLPKGLYGENQMNEDDVKAIGTWGSIDTTTAVDEETIYQITKTFWEHIDSVHAASKALELITPENAYKYMATPLHPGALRYYREIGWDVPDALVPPEAK